MAAKTGIRSTLNALALGTALLALPGAALAQEDHRDHGNGAPHQQEAPRPAPAPAPMRAPAPAPMRAPAPMGAAPAARGENMRGANPWNGQGRPEQGNPGGNGWQGRPQANQAPGQPRGDQGRNDNNPWRGGARPNDGGPARNDGGPGRYAGGPDRNDHGDWRGGHGPEGGPGRYDGGRGAPGYGQAWHGNPWSHNWRQDNRYDWRGWREANRDSFHVGRYYPPYRDYAYNRLGIGFYLQQMFFGQDYWIADPWYYHLPPAYGPYHWVRYYNDVILVNTYTGQVADVIYDFFW